MWRPSTGVWYVNRLDIGFSAFQFGIEGDIPLVGDYDADGRSDYGIWRPSTGLWYIYRSTLGVVIMQWGMQGDKPVVADYDGDGNQTWRYSVRAMGLVCPPEFIGNMTFGMDGDKPLVADLNGDGVLRTLRSIGPRRVFGICSRTGT